MICVYLSAISSFLFFASVKLIKLHFHFHVQTNVSSVEYNQQISNFNNVSFFQFDIWLHVLQIYLNAITNEYYLISFLFIIIMEHTNWS